MPQKIMKKIFTGVSWQHPVLNILFRIIDPIDYLARLVHGLSNLPPYSIRVRSNGVTKQFAGKNFNKFGILLAEHLKTYAFLNRQSKVLEIGCGCGRTAFALSGILEDGNFTGVDIEKKSLQSCQNNSSLSKKKFHFDRLDVYNYEYNPFGANHAYSYKFPYETNEFDVIFLVSVFTHMLTDDVKNYISEISRMIKPGGVCMLTTFLMDKESEKSEISFPYNEKDHFFYNKTMPEVAVGYFSNFYIEQFLSHGLKQLHNILWGNWRNNREVISTSGFSQDIIFFIKE